MSAILSSSKVYLAGGFSSKWQVLVTSHLTGIYELLDPSAHNIEDPIKYTKWDLDAIQQSDIILANMESTNPGGYSLALEVGFAKALGKEIILVDQIKDATVSRYFEMVRQCSNRIFSTLEDAIEHLLRQAK
ncbi:hypothetical protein GWQ29_15860 [Aeromonas sp. 2HA2]|uniref:nucleoside 2-deoxyribosyltransferase domain-containing protein n=1 Tax=unclassified Aeromonas TaxID=257493 RepID=UPI0023DDFF47|nr:MULTISPECIES: nucleoside 2-deoxyribosyltransferase domain-containing protein [unclassified Aeromonas]MDF2410889.1 hypothetical protein [Aeromonas sp. 2HA2]MDF2415276.1 hypothetical protein [Aeromonas sp. 1HA1]